MLTQPALADREGPVLSVLARGVWGQFTNGAGLYLLVCQHLPQTPGAGRRDQVWPVSGSLVSGMVCGSRKCCRTDLNQEATAA